MAVSGDTGSVASISRPLLVFPEGSITNGRVGTMRFAQTAFGLGAPVLPCALRLSTPLPLEADTIWSPLAMNVLWTLFLPFHLFEVSVLGEVSCNVGEAACAAQDVAGRIAAELGLVATDWTTKDKAARSRAAKQVGKAAWLKQIHSSQALQPNTSARR